MAIPDIKLYPGFSVWSRLLTKTTDESRKQWSLQNGGPYKY